MLAAIDPGPVESAYVVLDEHAGYPGELVAFGKKKESECISAIISATRNTLVVGVECVASYGMPVGRTTFDTAMVAGHFEAYLHPFADSIHRIYRKSKSDEGIDGVCMSICNDNRAKDSNIRQAIIDLYPATGGGKIPQIGTKDNPGPLCGVSKDVWAALAVALTLQRWRME